MGEHVKANMWCQRCGPVMGVEHTHRFRFGARGEEYRCQTCGDPVRQKTAEDQKATAEGGETADATESAAVESGPGVDLTLTSAGDRKIQVIKAIRAHTGLGLKEAKAIADSAPSPLLHGADAATADAFRRDVEAAGGSVKIRSLDPDQAASSQARSSRRPAESLIDELERLTALHDRGALTDEEFQEAKEQALTRPSASD